MQHNNQLLPESLATLALRKIECYANKINHLLLIICLFFLTENLHATIWDDAAKKIKQLDPSSFKTLPNNIIKVLEIRGCKIPQVYSFEKPHNVIQGQFAKKGQNDWAVLCSVNSASTLLVFWGGSTQCSSEIESEENINWLQGIGDGKIGYSRFISSADKKQMQKYQEYNGESILQPLSHEGIDVAFIGKASGVRYCYKGKWKFFSGAD